MQHYIYIITKQSQNQNQNSTPSHSASLVCKKQSWSVYFALAYVTSEFKSNSIRWLESVKHNYDLRQCYKSINSIALMNWKDIILVWIGLSGIKIYAKIIPLNPLPLSIHQVLVDHCNDNTTFPIPSPNLTELKVVFLPFD